MAMNSDPYSAKNLAELLTLLKAERGHSNDSLAEEIGISSTTIYRLLHGGKADDSTLDTIAAYIGVTRDWMYSLAKGTSVRPRYSPTVTAIAALLDQAPADIQEDAFAIIRALIDSRKKKRTKPE